MSQASRLRLCDCGSGRRFKSCCGALLAPGSDALKRDALAEQRAGNFSAAIALYERALLSSPHDTDALHMKAVSLYQLGCQDESLVAFGELLAELPDPDPAIWHNFGLTLATQPLDEQRLAADLAHYRVYQRGRLESAPETAPAISVVVASHDHERYLRRALESAFAQTLPAKEIVVIDDGSADGSVALLERLAAESPVPMRVRARTNRGAAATWNEAIEIATGEWIAPLNSDDAFATDRLERLAAALCRADIEWGFGGVDLIDDDDRPCAMQPGSRAVALRRTAAVTEICPTAGFSFLLANPAVSTGNLMFRKRLWKRIGGFPEWRYHHDWHFALAASRASEPVPVPEARYRYRIHGANTIASDDAAVRAELGAMLRIAYADCIEMTTQANPFAPVASRWSDYFFAAIGNAGLFGHLPDSVRRARAAPLVKPLRSLTA